MNINNTLIYNDYRKRERKLEIVLLFGFNIYNDVNIFMFFPPDLLLVRAQISERGHKRGE